MQIHKNADSYTLKVLEDETTGVVASTSRIFLFPILCPWVGSIQNPKVGRVKFKFGRFRINIHEHIIAVFAVDEGRHHRTRWHRLPGDLRVISCHSNRHRNRIYQAVPFDLYDRCFICSLACCYKKGIDQNGSNGTNGKTFRSIKNLSCQEWFVWQLPLFQVFHHIGEIVCFDQNIQPVAKTHFAPSIFDTSTFCAVDINWWMMFFMEH